MTKKEAAIISAYTGIFMGDFGELHKYIEQLLERPVWTHELADKNLMDKVKKLSKQDFIDINLNITD